MERLARRIGWRRVIVTAACLAAWRAMEQITVVPAQRSALLSLIAPSTPAYSIVALGVGPYVDTVILFTVVRAVSKTVRGLSDDEAGRRRLERWIRAVTAVLAAAQAYGYVTLISSNVAVGPLQGSTYVLALTGGTMVLVLLGDVLDEHGLGCGYGVYLIYLAAFVPAQIERVREYVAFLSANPGAPYQPLAIWLVLVIVLTGATVVVLSARRIVPLNRRRQRVELRFPLLMSGVLRPALLANALMGFPVLIVTNLYARHPETVVWMEQHWTSYGISAWGNALYTLLNAAVVLGMSCLVVAVDFNPRSIAQRLRNAHLTAADPTAGADTARFLSATAFRLAFAGGVFLAVVLGVVPVLTRLLTEGPSHNGPSVSTTLTTFLPALVMAIAAAMSKPRDDVVVLKPRVL